MEKQTLFEIKELYKKFRQPVIDNLNLSVKCGDLILIQGDNGCGKSTLLKLIAGLMEPDHGIVKFFLPHKLGILIENPSFIENETALYNMKFLVELTSKFNYEKIKEYFDLFSLNIDEKNSVKKYSVGMRQKLGIIQAVMEDQDCILFDEPTRGLDKSSMKVFNHLIHDLNQKEGKTIIICAHDGVQGIQFNRYLEMKDGKLFEN